MTNAELQQQTSGPGASGSTKEFDTNWKTRRETHYNHWVRGEPHNQIQLAFRSHWEVFQEILGPLAEKKGRSLEVGCGRGSISGYFADDGWDTVLLDTSEAVLKIAESIFERAGLQAEFVVGDANALAFEDNSFDVTVSIGLLEHFENVRVPIAEQVRVLKPGGWFLGYIVPERPDNVQRYFRWVNAVLKAISKVASSTSSTPKPEKEPIFRSDFYSDHYIHQLGGLPVKNVTAFGMYPMPMISHSPEFPFTLLPAPCERALVAVFRSVLALRRVLTGRHGWICSEKMGQAFLLAFQKAEASDGELS